MDWDNRHIYPFSAIVAQERMTRALILNAISPSIGGLLIRGEKGTAKSTAVRALAAVLPEIEIPLVGEKKELALLRGVVEKTAKEIDPKGKVKYKLGTMIELPRACVTADEIAEIADFLSFGTNDLTQTTYGFSRDDVGTFVPEYIEKGILKEDPFNVLDRVGVGSLMKTCIKLAKQTNPRVEIGICGEHGGEPNSVEFCHKIGLDYVSCSPFRVPIARLAATHAVIKEKNGKKS